MDSLVSAAWLAEHLHDPEVAIADCRFSLMEPDAGRQHYQDAHIPGAIYFDLNRDLSSPVQRHGGRHPLPDIDALASTLGRAGIASEPNPTLVVAYDDSCFAFAARFWWLLRYLGHDRVAVLDGGFQGWQAAGYPTTAEHPSPQPASFQPRPRPQWVVDREQVIDHRERPGTVLVDAREGDRYRGEREPIDPLAGHIPGAVNYFWKDIADATGHAYAPEHQRSRWQAVADADEIIVYCGSGVTACVDLLSLHLAGITMGKLYAGSWSDWCSYLQ